VGKPGLSSPTEGGGGKVAGNQRANVTRPKGWYTNLRSPEGQVLEVILNKKIKRVSWPTLQERDTEERSARKRPYSDSASKHFFYQDWITQEKRTAKSTQSGGGNLNRVAPAMSSGLKGASADRGTGRGDERNSSGDFSLQEKGDRERQGGTYGANPNHSDDKVNTRGRR